MADYRLGILQTDIGIVFGCMRPLVKGHPCVAAVLARISLRPDCCKIPITLTDLGSAGEQTAQAGEKACLEQLRAGAAAQTLKVEYSHGLIYAVRSFDIKSWTRPLKRLW